MVFRPFSRSCSKLSLVFTILVSILVGHYLLSVSLNQFLLNRLLLKIVLQFYSLVLIALLSSLFLNLAKI